MYKYLKLLLNSQVIFYANQILILLIRTIIYIYIHISSVSK